jgi:outer membrane protein
MHQAQAAGAQVKIYRSDYLPTLTAIGAYTAMGTGLPAANNFDVGVALTWPLFNGFETQHQVAEAKFQRDAIAHAIEDLRQHIQFQVTKAYLDLNAAEASIEKARTTMSAADLQLKLADERYRNGLGNIIEFETAQTQDIIAHADYVNSRYALEVANASLARAAALPTAGDWAR